MIKIIVNDKIKEKNENNNLINNKSFKLKDKASLQTTINSLIEDEEAAIKSYDVAIKNLEGSIDDTAKQVLINIRDDESRHIENLYSILNDNITEKNLEDSQNNNEIKLNFNNNHSIDENYFVGLEDLDKYMTRKNLDKYYVLSDNEKLLEKHLESLPETLNYEIVNKSILTNEGDERKLYAIITFKE